MPATIPCAPSCCSTTQTVNVPGIEGIPGTDAANGVNAYGITTAEFPVPEPGDDVTVSLDNGIWMVQGQKVVFDGPATFEVVSVNSATSVTLTFLGYAGDISPGDTIAEGAGVSPSGTQPSVFISYGSAYAEANGTPLLAPDDAVEFATISPAITLSSDGVWMLTARISIDNGNGNATVAGETLTFKLRRTNNTPADITETICEWIIPAVVSNGGTLLSITLPVAIYTASGSDDAIALYAEVSAIANAGAYVPVEASIIATKIS